MGQDREEDGCPEKKYKCQVKVIMEALMFSSRNFTELNTRSFLGYWKHILVAQTKCSKTATWPGVWFDRLTIEVVQTWVITVTLAEQSTDC